MNLKDYKVINEITYSGILKGISFVSERPVSIIGEQTIIGVDEETKEIKSIPQYIYTFDEDETNKKFIARKDNIIVF